MGSGTEAPGPGVVRAGRGLQRRTQPVLRHVRGLPETQGRGGGEKEEDAHVSTATTDQQGMWKTGRVPGGRILSFVAMPHKYFTLNFQMVHINSY